MMRLLLALLLSLGSIIPLARADSGSDPGELRRTWEAAWVFLPADTPAGYRRDGVGALEEVPAGSPVVVYAHGCDGLGDAAAESGRFLARAGYVAVMPDSFARLDKPVSCRPAQHQGGLHRGVIAWRQAELANALDQLAGLGHASRSVALYGLSQGAITVATFTGPPVAARVIEGWTCQAGWPEYRGLAAPADEPVLALLGERDPWFKAAVLRGDCGAYMTGRTGSRSVVFREPNFLARRHWLSFQPEVQSLIVDFLRASLR